MKGVMAVSDLIGKKVRNPDGDDLGKVEDVVLDLRNGRVAYAVFSFGGFAGIGDHLFAIPPASLVVGEDGEVVLHVDKDRLAKAPGFPRDRWPNFSDVEYGTKIYEYYGSPPYWT